MTETQSRKYSTVLAVLCAVGVILLVLGMSFDDILMRTAGISLAVIMGLTLLVHVVRTRKRR